MKSLYHSLTPTQDSPRIAKTLLSKEWFRLTDGQLQLYKQLYHIVFEINNDWYKVYAGNYSDDLVSFLGLLDFMNHFNSSKDSEQENLCYRLPVQLNEWAMTLVSMANTGEDLFPAEVIFTKAENRIYADII